MDSFLTLGITVKMQAGIISIPAPCFIIVQKEKNLDPLEEKPVKWRYYIFLQIDSNPLLPYTIRLRTLNLLLYPFFIRGFVNLLQ